MYKVFINDSYINITSQGKTSPLLSGKNFLENPVPVVQAIADEKDIHHLTFECENAVECFNDFISFFTVVEAAGGIVKNKEGDCLLIKRLGKWDLPKGKMETGETKEQSAVREVMEECAIPKPAIKKPLPTTYHFYAQNGKAIIKPTYWYLMQVKGIPEVNPQTEEGITEVIWASPKELRMAMENTYASIKWLVEESENN